MKWEDFKKQIKSELHMSPDWRIYESCGKERMIFRGHADTSWKLETTLERHGYHNIKLEDYVKHCLSAEKYIGNSIPNTIYPVKEPDCSFKEARLNFPNYEYSAFLRHHGFPSPLLDWSESPYVSAFFAFYKVAPGVDKVAIYGLRPHQFQNNSSLSNKHIRNTGPFAKIDGRHIAQQSRYTYCLEDKNNICTICSHEDFVDNESILSNGKNLCKWEIDTSERDKVLGELFQMNITPYSLFGSIESAADTAALKILHSTKA